MKNKRRNSKIEEKQNWAMQDARRETVDATLKEIMGINFYDWNEQTQRMIKDKISSLSGEKPL